MATDELAALIKRFPAHEFQVRRLHASNREFKALCEDHALAADAAKKWKDDEVRFAQYLRLVSELEDEVLEFIEGRHPDQIGKTIDY